MRVRSLTKKTTNTNKTLTTQELIFWGFALCVVFGFIWFLIFKFSKNDGDTFYDFVKFNLKFELAYRAVRGVFSSIFD